MDTTARLASYLIDRLRGSRTPRLLLEVLLLLLAVLLLLASFAVTFAVAGVFPSEAGPVVVAPFRW